MDSRRSTAIVHPVDGNSIRGAVNASQANLIIPVFVGPEARIRAAASTEGIDLSSYKLISTRHSHEAAERAVALAREGEVDALMKGSLHTDELMHEAVAKETGLCTKRRMSHVFVMDVPEYPPSLLLLTDAAINIYPCLEDKRDIVQNAIDLARILGIVNSESCNPRRCRNCDPQVAIDAGGGGAVQDGRSWPDHRRPRRRPVGFR